MGCLGSKENAADFEAHHVRHNFFDVGLAHDMNAAHRKTMEDAHTVKVPYVGDDSAGFFAIYDGHGGSEVSQEASKQLHMILETEILSKGANSSSSMKASFESAYAKTDELVKPVGADKGSTAVTCLVRKEGNRVRLYCANAGDARAILCRKGKAIRLSQDHKPSDEKEKVRLAEVGGGFVTNDRVNGILGVSRAIGDHQLKRWVVSTPYFIETDLVYEDSMMIMACDGVWDVLTDQEALELARGEKSAQRVSEKLVKEAIRKNTKDNVSVLTIRFKWTEGSAV